MIYPMFALIILTCVVAGYLLNMRIAAVKAGEMSLGSFRLNNNPDTPTKMLQASRNYSNLFEVPILFYTAGAISIALNINSPTINILSWVFFISRCVHSWIHVTNNNVIHRLQAFLAGNICVLLIWIILVCQYSTRVQY